MMAATGTVAAIAGIALAPLLSHGHPGVAMAYRLALAGVLASCVGNTYLFALMGGALGLWNRARLSQPLVALAGVIVAWRLGMLTLDGAATVLLGSLVAEACLAYWGCRRAGLLPGRFAADLVRPLATYGLSQIAAMAPAAVNAYLDQLVLSVAVPAADLGRYSVAVSMTLLPCPLVSAIGYVLMPRLAAREASDPENRRIPVRVVLASAGVATAILVPLALIAPFLVPRVFGAAYQGAVPLVWILTPGGIFLACDQVAANVLRGLRRQSVVAWAEGIAIAFTLALLGGLVPVIGVTGAAIASTVSYGVSLALMTYSLRSLPRDRHTHEGA
jgi:O-antigen/teichoic acid export membrane protein